MKKNYRYEGQYESKKKHNIQEACEFILEQNYGNTISDTDLAKILGYNINDELEFKQYKIIMARVRNFLLQYGYVLKSISGVGYYILKPEQVTRHCYKTYIKRASRLYDKSAFVLDRTDKTEMNKDRLEEINNMMELNKQLIEKVENTIMESRYYSRKDYYDSLEVK